jgi:ribonuclease P protein component
MRFSRLPGREFRQGQYRRAVDTPYFSIRIKRSNTGKQRAGVVVGVAVNKSATRRNFWKRQVMETLRSLPAARHDLHESELHDLLVILSPKINALTKKQFREKLSAAASALR